MAAVTITGTVKLANNSAAASMPVKFVPQETPQADGSNLVVGTETQVVTDSSGLLPSLTLFAGKYTVYLGNGESFNIDVPDGAGPYAIEAIIDNTASSSDTSTYTRRLYTMATALTISNQTQTSLFGSGVGSLVTAANYMTAGKVLHSCQRGYYTTTASPGALTFRLSFPDTVEQLSVAPTPPASMTQALIEIDSWMTCATAGASGTQQGVLRVSFFNPNTGAILGYADTDLDLSLVTTSANTFKLTAQWTNASQTLVILNSFLEAIP